jgi:hypothetical protein
MLGNEMLAASEEISSAEGWKLFVAQVGLSARSVRRYVAFARWANEHTEDFAALLHMRRQPSFLRAKETAQIVRMFRVSNVRPGGPLPPARKT